MWVTKTRRTSPVEMPARATPASSASRQVDGPVSMSVQPPSCGSRYAATSPSVSRKSRSSSCRPRPSSRTRGAVGIERRIAHPEERRRHEERGDPPAPAPSENLRPVQGTHREEVERREQRVDQGKEEQRAGGGGVEPEGHERRDVEAGGEEEVCHRTGDAGLSPPPP